MKKWLLILTLLISRLYGYGSLSHDSTDYFYTSDSTKLYVEKSGTGPVCIFIHGGPGAWSRSFSDLGGKQLEDSLTMVYYDQRGSGRSASPLNGDYSLERMLLDIDEIRRHFGVTQVYLLAHSFGGILATNYAANYADHVKGLVMACATLDMRSSLMNQIGYVNKRLGRDFKPLDSSFGAVKTAFLSARKALADSGLQYTMLSDDKKAVDLVDAIDKQSPSDYGFARQVFDMPVYWQNYRPLSKKVGVATLVITGAKDHAIGAQHYWGFEYPRKHVVRLPAGHLSYYENNTAFIKAVFGFVRLVER